MIQITDRPDRFKLGRKPAVLDPRTLQFHNYTKTLAPPPPAVDYTKGITSFGVAMNDVLGDCVIAGAAHAVQIWTANTGSEQTTPDQTVENIYDWWCGYVPGDPNTDNGCVEIFTLRSWLKHKFNGHRLRAFTSLNLTDLNQIRQAINLFALAYIGFNVPQSVMDNANDTSVVWDVGGDETIVGGHCVVLPKYTADGLFSCVSWGNVYQLTPAFIEKFVDEAYALMSQDWFDWNTGLSASGFDFNQLWADLAAI